MTQDCSKEDPAPVGPTYCATEFDPSQSMEVGRGCFDLHKMPEMPEPPLGHAMCVDLVNPTDQEKVFNEKLVLNYI